MAQLAPLRLLFVTITLLSVSITIEAQTVVTEIAACAASAEIPSFASPLARADNTLFTGDFEDRAVSIGDRLGKEMSIRFNGYLCDALVATVSGAETAAREELTALGFDSTEVDDYVTGCTDAVTSFGTLSTGAGTTNRQFVAAQDRRVQVRLDKLPTYEVPFLRFWMAAEPVDESFCSSDVDFQSGRFLEIQYPLTGGSFTFERVTFVFNFSFDPSVLSVPCPTTGLWRRYTVPAENYIVAMADGTIDPGKVVGVGMAIAGCGYKVAIDQVEYVGEPLDLAALASANGLNEADFSNRLYALPEITVLSAQDLIFGEAVDAVMTVVAPLLIVVVLIYVLSSPILRSSSIALERVEILWTLVSLMLVVYAFLELQGFVGNLEDVKNQTKFASAAYLAQREELNAVEVNEKLTSGFPFGAVGLFLPALDAEMVTSVFTIIEDDTVIANDPLGICDSGVKQFYTTASASFGTVQVSGGCTANATTFLEPLIPEGYVNTTSFDRSHRVVLVAEIEQSQDYWIDILEISLISDAAMAFGQVLLLGALKIRHLSSERIAKVILAANIVTIAVGLALSGLVLYFVVVDPVRYTSTMALAYDGLDPGFVSFSGAVYVQPKPEVVKIGADGSFFLDSGPVIGTLTRCASSLSEITEQEKKMAFEVIGPTVLPVARNYPRIESEAFFPPRGENPEFMTCDYDGSLTTYVRPDGSACYEADCSSGVIPLVSQDVAQPLLNFLFNNVVYNVIVVDLIITLIDLFFVYIGWLLLKYLLKNKQETSEDGKVVSAKAEA